jgi:hypothetical protein
MKVSPLFHVYLPEIHRLLRLTQYVADRLVVYRMSDVLRSKVSFTLFRATPYKQQQKTKKKNEEQNTKQPKATWQFKIKLQA